MKKRLRCKNLYVSLPPYTNRYKEEEDMNIIGKYKPHLHPISIPSHLRGPPLFTASLFNPNTYHPIPLAPPIKE
jgi:hypothetical protein